LNLRGLVATGYSVYKTLAISVPTVADALTGRLTRERCDARLASWSRSMLDVAGVEVVTEGRERVPDRPVIFMSNHGSHLDIPIVYVACPGSVRMVAKAELFRVPLWGRAMRDAGFISVDRSGDREQAKQAMDEAARVIQAGTSVWIAPEGTRSRTGQLGRLKRGGFRLAIGTATPIVPLRIDGARELLPKGARVIAPGGTVHVRFGDPISTLRADEEQLVAAVEAFLA
jgi:1-acyl-sn-glycerol-3-phosphate acyltransferase